MSRKHSLPVRRVALLLALLAGAPLGAQSVFVRGDLNGDGSVNFTSDAPAFLNYYFAFGPLGSAASLEPVDVNDDGGRSFADFHYFSDFLYRGGAEPPPPFRAPGLDPTPGGPAAPRLAVTFELRDAVAAPGGWVIVPVYLDYRALTPSPAAIRSYTVNFRFDATYLTLVGADASPSVAASGPILPTLGAAEGRLIVSLQGLRGGPHPGIAPGQDIHVADLTFQVIAAAGPPYHTLVELTDDVFSATPEDRSLLSEVVIENRSVRPTLVSGRVLIQSGPFLRGDVDGNGRVDSSDGTAIAKYLEQTGLISSVPAAADVNDDGMVTVLDTVCLLAFLYRGATAPAAPFPAPGLASLRLPPPPSTAMSFRVTGGDVYEGSPHTLQVLLTSAGAVEGLTVSLQYDPAILNITSVSFAPGLPPGNIVLDPTAGTITATTTFRRPLAPQAGVPLLDIEVAPASYPLEYTYITFRDGPAPAFLPNEVVTSLSGCTTVRPTVVEEPIVSRLRFVRGDCNADGACDISDAARVLACRFQGDSRCAACLDPCDTNDDGDIDVSDAVYLLSAKFHRGAPPVPPPLSCDRDPTPDRLIFCSQSSCP